MGKIKGKITTSEYMNLDQFNTLCDGLHNDKQYIWELYARVSFCTALRISDVLSLRWKDIIGVSELCITEKKTKKTRLIKLNPSVQNKISELYCLLNRPKINELVFKSKNSESAYSREYVNSLMKFWNVEYNIGLKRISSHTFRKSFGRYVYEQSGKTAESLILLNSIFKHSSISITKIYIGIQEDEINTLYESIRF